MRKKWIECGFSDFIDGMFGNAGQNIYVSKKGRLQRIFRYDFNKDGYVDVAYGNSQDMGERPDITVVNKPLVNDEIIYLPTQGAFAGICIDLNGDGNDDLVIANQNNGTHTDVPAFVYYGSDRGITGKYRIELPAPNSFDVTAGDFRGIGLKDLAFSSDGRIRVFSYKEQGYYECDFYDVDIGCRVLFVDSGDVNNDGYDDLYVRTAEGRMFILWGSEKGLDAENFSELSFTTDPVEIRTGSTEARMLWNNTWRPCIVELGGKRLLYSTGNNRAVFYKVEGTKITEEFSIDIKGTVYALSADCMNSGYNDLVLCVCEDIEKTEESYIFKGNDKGIDPNDFIKFEACSLRSVAVDDIDGDGNKELVLCQGKNGILYSVDTPVYRIIDKKVSKIVNYVSHDAIDVFCATSKLNKQIVYINHESGRIRGDVEFNVFYNGPDGFNENKKDILDTWAGTDTICCDFNDNGFHDLVICNCAENSVSQGIDPGSFLFHGGPDGFKKECKTVFPTLRAHGCAVGDFRRSGYLDIAFGGFHNPCIKIFKGDEKGFDLSNPQKIVLDPKLDESYEPAPPSRLIFSDKNSEKLDTDYCEVRFLMAADLNNDGFLDLCVSQIIGDYFIILWGGPNGFSRDNMTRLPVVNSVCSQVADLNNDGWPDLIIGGYMYKSKKWTKDSCVTIFWGSPEGFDKRRCTQLPGHSCNSLTVADFNNDGILDIFVTSYNGGRDRDLDAYLYWGQPNGVYSEKHRKRFFTHSSCGCLALDFNNDGFIDLAVSNHKTYGDHKGYSQIWYNSKDGFKEENIKWLPTNGPHGLMAVDAGNIMDRSPEEIYISNIKELEWNSTIKAISWEAVIYPLTWVRCQIRCADGKEGIDNAKWYGPEGVDTWFETGGELKNVCLKGNFVQYKLALGAKNGGNSPVVTSVTVEYE